MKKKYIQLIYADWYSVGRGKLQESLLTTLSAEIKTCLQMYAGYPELTIGTDSQRIDPSRYRYTASVTISHRQELRNVLTKIFYKKFLYTPASIPVDPGLFEVFNTKRLLKEGKITAALSMRIQKMLIEEGSPMPITAHFDYQQETQQQVESARYSGSYAAYLEVKEYLAHIDISDKILLCYKPDAPGASKIADRMLRTAS